MKMSCEELFRDIEHRVVGDARETVSGIAYRSDAVQPGDAFFCIVGMTVDGHSFAQDAINRGAKVLVVERKLYLADATDVTEIVVKDSRKALAVAADTFYGHPSQDMHLVGITGTNGKTTTTYLVEHIARSLHKRTGIIGTVGIKIGNKTQPSSHTTPESSDLQKLFAEMRDARCDVVAMEVSSHALDLYRTYSTKFAVTAFTNLTQDHLDYHQTFEAYFEAKALLFSGGYPAHRVINIDDKYGKELLRRCSSADDYIISTGFDHTAHIYPAEVIYGQTSTRVILSVRGTRYDFTYPLVGRFNVSNMMTAFGIALCLGYKPEDIIKALATTPGVPGRLERVIVPNDGGVSVFVDYAHTPDALEKALGSIMALKPRRTLVVFGCGGDRDATKRPIMGKVALAADYAIVTSDNPRTEDPNAIINDIVGGMSKGADHYEVIPDRRAAIARAIELAEEGDAVLIAGKGHEDYQIIGTEKTDFDDRKVAAEELIRVFGVDEG